jgi:general secretion pathway protein G
VNLRLREKITTRDLVTVLAGALLLASFAIPAFSGYIERSRVARAVSDIGTLSLQLYLYRRAADTSKTQLRKDDELVPLNSDFDLYSLGPDGESALALPAAPSHDDVVRAGNGSYIGLAVNY